MEFILFPTEFGACAIAWRDAVIARFHLPKADEASTLRRLNALPQTTAIQGAAPSWLAALVTRVQLHLSGHPQDFSDLALDWPRVSSFQAAVYRQTQRVKPGFTTSYGAIARALSLGPESSRAVGVALATNPWPLLVPCHRVVAANDHMTGFSGPGGIRTKTRLLALEGAVLLSE